MSKARPFPCAPAAVLRLFCPLAFQRGLPVELCLRHCSSLLSLHQAAAAIKAEQKEVPMEEWGEAASYEFIVNQVTAFLSSPDMKKGLPLTIVLSFHCLLLTFALTFHCLSLTTHCLFLTIHCLPMPFLDLPLPFHCLPLTRRSANHVMPCPRARVEWPFAIASH